MRHVCVIYSVVRCGDNQTREDVVRWLASSDLTRIPVEKKDGDEFPRPKHDDCDFWRHLGEFSLQHHASLVDIGLLT